MRWPGASPSAPRQSSDSKPRTASVALESVAEAAPGINTARHSAGFEASAGLAPATPSLPSGTRGGTRRQARASETTKALLSCAFFDRSVERGCTRLDAISAWIYPFRTSRGRRPTAPRGPGGSVVGRRIRRHSDVARASVSGAMRLRSPPAGTIDKTMGTWSYSGHRALAPADVSAWDSMSCASSRMRSR